MITIYAYGSVFLDKDYTEKVPSYFNEPEVNIKTCISIGELLALTKECVETPVILWDLKADVESAFNELGEYLSVCPKLPKIILLISSVNSAIKGYEYGVFRCVLKSSGLSELTTAIQSAITEKKAKDRTVVFSCKNGIARIELNDLLYVQLQDRKLFIYVNNSQPIIRNGPIKDFYSELNDRRFCMIDKNCFVNINHILLLLKDTVRLDNNVELPVSRRMKPLIKEQLLRKDLEYVN